MQHWKVGGNPLGSQWDKSPSGVEIPIGTASNSLTGEIKGIKSEEVFLVFSDEEEDDFRRFARMLFDHVFAKPDLVDLLNTMYRVPKSVEKEGRFVVIATERPSDIARLRLPMPEKISWKVAFGVNLKPRPGGHQWYELRVPYERTN